MSRIVDTRYIHAVTCMNPPTKYNGVMRNDTSGGSTTAILFINRNVAPSIVSMNCTRLPARIVAELHIKVLTSVEFVGIL